MAFSTSSLVIVDASIGDRHIICRGANLAWRGKSHTDVTPAKYDSLSSANIISVAADTNETTLALRRGDISKATFTN
eukprot:8200379-Ditylum_brightwellii.AAC.1